MTEETKRLPRWTEDEVESVRDYIWGKAEQPPLINRTDEAIDSKFAEDFRELRKLGRDSATRHRASMIALATVRDKGITSEGGHIAHCNRILNLAFFVGGYNTDPLAQKCREAALAGQLESAA
jgi:hypothetical protein